jgi:putative Mn2+ efflux pump MntP
MLALLLIAASLGLSNFAAAIAIGVSGVDARTRLSVGMALAGLELGRLLGIRIGERGEALGGIVLVGVGIAIGSGLL